MKDLPIPALPDLARAFGETRDELISWFVTYYETIGAPFNYLSGTRSIKHGYKGLHAIAQLIRGCSNESTVQGRKSNEEVVNLAAPIAFGRTTQVFDLPRMKFPFGRDLHAAYRIPFFFVENGVVKLYFLQPRKGSGLNYDQLCMVATIHKRYLLDTEFFGNKVDVEYVDLGAEADSNQRSLRTYSLEALNLWSEQRLADRLTVVAEALDYVRASGIVRPRKRLIRRPSPDMPLFD